MDLDPPAQPVGGDAGLDLRLFRILTLSPGTARHVEDDGAARRTAVGIEANRGGGGIPARGAVDAENTDADSGQAPAGADRVGPPCPVPEVEQNFDWAARRDRLEAGARQRGTQFLDGGPV